MAEMPNRLDALKALIEQSGLRHSIDNEVLAILDELLHRVYALEQNHELVKAKSRSNGQQIDGLRRQYSELGYKFAELKQSTDSKR